MATLNLGPVFSTLLIIFSMAFTVKSQSAFNLTGAEPLYYSTGGAKVNFFKIPVGNLTAANLTCLINHSNSHKIITVPPSLTVAKDQISCRLPEKITQGKVDITLGVHSSNGAPPQLYSQTYFLIPDPRLDLQVDENWANMAIKFTWDPAMFAAHFGPGDNIFLQGKIFVSQDGSSTFKESSVTLSLGFNSAGTTTLSIASAQGDLISSLNYPYFYVVRAVGLGDQDVYLSSRLITPTLGKTESIAQQICSNWLQDSSGPPSDKEVIPCPNCLCKAVHDESFTEGKYDPQIVSLAGGSLSNHVLYYQTVPTASGHAQTCSYNRATTALATSSPSTAAWIHYSSKDLSYVDNYLSDIWPYIVCCMQSKSEQFCTNFHEKRPISTGHDYEGPDDPCQGSMDPHMITFDRVYYDFMGFGEFWLIRGPEWADHSQFGVQGRMAPHSKDQKVTYFRAVALREGNTTVQVQYNQQTKLPQIILNKEEILAMPRTKTAIPLNGMSILIDGSVIKIRLATGFTLKIQTYSHGQFINLYGFGAKYNKGKGYGGIFGLFDGNSTNDLTSRTGIVIPPAQYRNLSLIHNVFGLSWMTSEEESYFIYEEGTSWNDHADSSFGPILEYPDPSQMPEEVRKICGDNLACYYEYIGTGELGDAELVAEDEKEFEELKEEMDEIILLCDPIPPPENGGIHVEGYLNGSVANYYCKDEYDFLRGSVEPSKRICKETGGDDETENKLFWDGVEPTCHWTCGKCTEQMESDLSPDPSDCAQFFLCISGERHILPCPPGQGFNRETAVCDELSGCENGRGC